MSLFFFLNSTRSPSISMVSGHSNSPSGRLRSEPALGRDDCLTSNIWMFSYLNTYFIHLISLVCFIADALQTYLHIVCVSLKVTLGPPSPLTRKEADLKQRIISCQSLLKKKHTHIWGQRIEKNKVILPTGAASRTTFVTSRIRRINFRVHVLWAFQLVFRRRRGHNKWSRAVRARFAAEAQFTLDTRSFNRLSPKLLNHIPGKRIFRVNIRTTAKGIIS